MTLTRVSVSARLLLVRRSIQMQKGARRGRLKAKIGKSGIRCEQLPIWSRLFGSLGNARGGICQHQ